MTDPQLKIRIQIKQHPQSITPQDSELESNSTPEEEIIKPPFDWQKIAGAVLLVIGVFGFIGFVLFEGKEDQSLIMEIDSVVAENKTSTSSKPQTQLDSTPVPTETETELKTETKTEAEAEAEAEAKNIAEAIVLSEKKLEENTVLPRVAEIAIQNDTSNELDAVIEENPIIQADAASSDVSQSLVNSIQEEDHSYIVRAQLTSAIRQREPVDIIDHISLDQGASTPIYLFVQLRDMGGQRVSVHWFYEDKQVAKVNLEIGHDNNWRTYASKLLSKTRLGAWRAALYDQSGKLLAERSFTVNNPS